MLEINFLNSFFNHCLTFLFTYFLIPKLNLLSSFIKNNRNILLYFLLSNPVHNWWSLKLFQSFNKSQLSNFFTFTINFNLAILINIILLIFNLNFLNGVIIGSTCVFVMIRCFLYVDAIEL